MNEVHSSILPQPEMTLIEFERRRDEYQNVAKHVSRRVIEIL